MARLGNSLVAAARTGRMSRPRTEEQLFIEPTQYFGRQNPTLVLDSIPALRREDFGGGDVQIDPNAMNAFYANENAFGTAVGQVGGVLNDIGSREIALEKEEEKADIQARVKQYELDLKKAEEELAVLGENEELSITEMESRYHDTASQLKNHYFDREYKYIDNEDLADRVDTYQNRKELEFKTTKEKVSVKIQKRNDKRWETGVIDQAALAGRNLSLSDLQQALEAVQIRKNDIAYLTRNGADALDNLRGLEESILEGFLGGSVQNNPRLAGQFAQELRSEEGGRFAFIPYETRARLADATNEIQKDASKKIRYQYELQLYGNEQPLTGEQLADPGLIDQDRVQLLKAHNKVVGKIQKKQEAIAEVALENQYSPEIYPSATQKNNERYGYAYDEYIATELQDIEPRIQFEKRVDWAVQHNFIPPQEVRNVVQGAKSNNPEQVQMSLAFVREITERDPTLLKNHDIPDEIKKMAVMDQYLEPEQLIMWREKTEKMTDERRNELSAFANRQFFEASTNRNTPLEESPYTSFMEQFGLDKEQANKHSHLRDRYINLYEEMLVFADGNAEAAQEMTRLSMLEAGFGKTSIGGGDGFMFHRPETDIKDVADWGNLYLDDVLASAGLPFTHEDVAIKRLGGPGTPFAVIELATQTPLRFKDGSFLIVQFNKETKNDFIDNNPDWQDAISQARQQREHNIRKEKMKERPEVQRSLTRPNFGLGL